MSDLFQAMKEYSGRSPDTGGRDRFRSLLLEQGYDALAAKLAAEGAPLWRYSGGAPFNESGWWETLSVGWGKRGSFPTLYKENRVYDKREVAACLLLTAGVSLSEADAILDELSVRNQSCEVRRLYPLHFKESFFVWSWRGTRVTESGSPFRRLSTPIRTMRSR